MQAYLFFTVFLLTLSAASQASVPPPALPAPPDSLRDQLRTATGPARVDALLRVAQAFRQPLDSAGMVHYAVAAEHLARQLGDSIGVGRAVDVHGYYFLCAGDARRAAPLLRRARLLLELAPATVQATNLAHLGELHESLTRPEQALGYYRRAYTLARQAKLPQQQAAILLNMGIAYQQPGSYDSAAYYHIQAARLYRRLGDKAGEANTLTSLGSVYYEQNRLPEAIRYVRQSYSLLRQTSDGRQLGLTLSALGALAIASDSLQTALGHYRQLLGIMRRGAAYGRLENAYNGLAVVHERLHRPDSAEWYYQRAVAALQPLDNPHLLGFQMNNLARFYLKQKRYAEARHWANRTLSLDGGRLDPSNTPDAWEILRQVAERQGDFATAYQLLSKQHELQLKQQAQENDRLAADLRVGYETEQAEQQVQLLTQANALARFRQLALLVAAGLTMLLLAGALLWAYRRRQQRREAALRTQLAADLHDDVGGLLTQISLESALLQEGRYTPEQQQARLGRVAEASRSAARQMSDVVWSVDARNDSFASMLERMHDHAAEVLPPADIELEFMADPALKALPLGLLARQNLYLIFKEALHNVIKHAQASVVTVRLTQAAGQLQLEVRDNGRGGSGTEQLASHGLRNMRMRAQAVGGSVSYHDGAPGFLVSVTLPL
jgi:signal transduction histidine kinase